MNGFLQQYGLNIVAVIIVLAFVVFGSIFGDTVTSGIKDITADFFAKSGITVSTDDELSCENKEGKHYHNNALFTGTCEGTEYYNGFEAVEIAFHLQDALSSDCTNDFAINGMTWKDLANDSYWCEICSSCDGVKWYDVNYGKCVPLYLNGDRVYADNYIHAQTQYIYNGSISCCK